MLNEHGEFEDASEPPMMRLRTDDEKRQEAIDKLVSMGVIGICDVCGKPFRREGHLKHAKRCSKECTREAGRRTARERKRMEAGITSAEGIRRRLQRAISELEAIARELA